MVPTTPVHPHLWNEGLASCWTNNLMGRVWTKKLVSLGLATFIMEGKTETRDMTGLRHLLRTFSPSWRDRASFLGRIDPMILVRSVHRILTSTFLCELLHLSLHTNMDCLTSSLLTTFQAPRLMPRSSRAIVIFTLLKWNMGFLAKYWGIFRSASFTTEHHGPLFKISGIWIYLLLNRIIFPFLPFDIGIHIRLTEKPCPFCYFLLQPSLYRWS